MTTTAVTYDVVFNPDGSPQPLTLVPPGGPGGFTLWSGAVITNYTGSVAVLQNVDDTASDTPALPPFTSELYAWTSARGNILVTWATAGALTQGACIIVTYSTDPAVDFSGKVYPASVPPAPVATTSIISGQVTEAMVAFTPFCQTVTVPAGTTALQLYATFVSGFFPASLSVKVTGVTSSIQYFDETVAPSNPTTMFTVPINSGVDTEYEVCWQVNQNGTWDFTVASSLSPTGVPINVTCNCSGGGSGAMVASGVYSCSNDGTTGTMTWTAVNEVGTPMLQSDTETFDFPSGTIVMATLFGGVELPAGASFEFVDTATGAMEAVADNTTGTTTVGIPLSASYNFDETLDSSTQFDATVAGGPAFNTAYTLVLSAFTRP